MKKISKIAVAAIVILSLLIIAPVNNTKAQFSASISFQTFYSELSPYGQWVDDPEYGYVWVPDVDPGFRPYYTSGHWVMTRYGAMWVSGYSWGWAPFHYGRWVYNSYYGWVWIPDTVWGPAWVSWRWGGSYCGWAPLGPGISIGFSFGSSYSVPYDWWVFVPQRYCLSASFYNYRLASVNNITYVRNTTIINNTYVNNNVTYAAGPRINDIQKVTGNKVSVYNVSNGSRPGKTSVLGNSVMTYRPQVTKASKGNAKPPSVVSRDQFIKNKGQRNTGAVQQQNNRTERKQVNQPVQQKEQKPVQQREQNTKQIPERRQQINQPQQKIEQRQIPQQKQNNNKQIIPERRQQINQPQTERRQVQQQNNDRQVIQERRQQINQPQTERRQIQQQQRQPVNQPAPQQGQPNPGKGKGKGHN